MLDKNRVGLTLGSFLALLHAAWSVLITTGWAQYLADKAISLHMMKMPHEVLAFNPLKALLLVGIAFLVGYIGGWIFAVIYNKFGK